MLYRITIERDDKTPGNTVIECTSNYTLDRDLAEWVREEIDPAATVTVQDDSAQITTVESETRPAQWQVNVDPDSPEFGRIMPGK